MSSVIEKLRLTLHGSIAFRLAIAGLVLALSAIQFYFGIAEHRTSMLIYGGVILLLGITVVWDTLKRKANRDR
ncbi:hypothetical protein [Mycobacteroides abscessus]|uniref:hypothetical protein n=1 Tax=Mycobacteroides abscessus TaxID=36809 RepID=UPI000C258352|nr:hypothetical protein [Mycobacteroides abscessus]